MGAGYRGGSKILPRRPGVGHAFMNDTRPDFHRPEDAAIDWQRMAVFPTGSVQSTPFQQWLNAGLGAPEVPEHLHRVFAAAL